MPSREARNDAASSKMLASLDVRRDENLGCVLGYQSAVLVIDATQRRRIVVPAQEPLLQRVGTDAVLERRPRQMNESPAALRRAEPEVPVLPVAECDVIAAHVAPDRAAHHGTGVDVIAPEHPWQIELRHDDVALPRAELAA